MLTRVTLVDVRRNKRSYIVKVSDKYRVPVVLKLLRGKRTELCGKPNEMFGQCNR